MRTLDRIVVVLWILLGIAVCAYARGLGVFGPSGPASGFFPMITGVVIALSGVAIGVSRSDRPPEAARFFPDGMAALRVGIVIGAILLMIVLIPHLGYLLTGVLVTPLLLRAIEPRSWAFCIGVGAAGAAAIVLLFAKGLNVPLPRGPLGF